MLRLSNIRIGTKLAVMSGIGVALVVAMAAAAMYGNSLIKGSNAASMSQQEVVREAGHIELAFVNIRMAVRNIRLATTMAELKAADNLETRQKDIDKLFEKLIPQLNIPANRERAATVQAAIRQYVATALKETVPTKLEALNLDPKDSARTIALYAEMQRIQHEDLDPGADKGIAALDEMQKAAVNLAEHEVENADQQMAFADTINLGIAAAVVMVLIGSALFGAFSIARPLGKIAAVLNELTQDRIVDVPYANRGDEVGDIAKATEIFKQSIAEKITNLRVRSELDVVRSNVMIADDNYNIMYMNATFKEMMRDAEAELRKALPGFDSNKLLGACMDVFHKNPAHQRKVLDQLTGTFDTHIAVGALKFHLVATAVMDQHGKRAGTVVEWRNETVETAIEGEVDDIVKSAAAGDFSRRVPLEGKKGFMLNLATAMNGLCENTSKALNDLADMMSALANGDLTQRISSDYHGMFGKLKDDANMMAEQIGSAIGEIKSSTREVTNASAEISTSTTDLSQRTEEQAASLEETSASMEEISATVKKNAENAQEANQSATGAREVADRGGKIVAKAVEAMGHIEGSSRKISDIITVIDEIARQTNLLALNAAVEAARAGDAGRGFAVVATEVRSLAQRSSQAAKDIKDLITNSNGQVREGVDLVNKAGEALAEIVGSIKSVADIVGDIAAASTEQATGIEQVNKALAQMDEVTQQNSALVEENAATAKALENQAQAMSERVAFFRIEEAAGANSTSYGGATPARSAMPAAKSHMTGKPAAAAVEKAPPARAAKQHAPAASGGPVGRMQTKLATAFKEEPAWKEF